MINREDCNLVWWNGGVTPLNRASGNGGKTSDQIAYNPIHGNVPLQKEAKCDTTAAIIEHLHQLKFQGKEGKTGQGSLNLRSCSEF